MEQYVKRTQRDYSMSFKLSVIRQIEQGELTYIEAAKHYGIQSHSTVLNWLRKHSSMDWCTLGTSSKQRTSTMDKEPLTPEQRIKELEVQLLASQQKAQLFEAIVEVIRTQYPKPLVKKSSGKLSKPSKQTKPACQHYGISRQAYSKQACALNAKASTANKVVQLVRDQRIKLPQLGTRKLYYLLKPSLAELQIKLGRDGLFDVLRGANMLVKPKRAYHKTTNSHHRFRKHPNLLKEGEQQVIAKDSEQVWVADITYIPTQKETVYLSLVTDAYSRKIVGHHVHDSLHTEQVAKALSSAIKERQTEQRLVHHSDRGVQYCSNDYQSIHEVAGITCSMTDGYDCYQNALAERINGILKQEFLLELPQDLAQARKIIAESIEAYNSLRPHLSLEYKTPDAVHRASISKFRNRTEVVT
jgi:putative transposase